MLQTIDSQESRTNVSSTTEATKSLVRTTPYTNPPIQEALQELGDHFQVYKNGSCLLGTFLPGEAVKSPNSGISRATWTEMFDYVNNPTFTWRHPVELIQHRQAAWKPICLKSTIKREQFHLVLNQIAESASYVEPPNITSPSKTQRTFREHGVNQIQDALMTLFKKSIGIPTTVRLYLHKEETVVTRHIKANASDWEQNRLFIADRHHAFYILPADVASLWLYRPNRSTSGHPVMVDALDKNGFVLFRMTTHNPQWIKSLKSINAIE
ncbi:MAG: hypothetical protein AAF558_11685 [Verrucomicrobiota bacterium]